MAVALLVAAGRGERLGSGRPKALVNLGGRPMLEWSLQALRAVPEIDRIVMALPEAALQEAGSCELALHDAPHGTIKVAGGAERSQSVRHALAAAGPGDPVVVHDAARPLVTPELFGRALDELARTGVDGVITALPVSDTIKEVADDGQTVRQTLRRDRLWAVQTPQVFRRARLEQALSAPEARLRAATDDAWLVEQAGGTVTIVLGSPQNLKVTTPLDLRVAELLLSERGR